jgi:hypothetical protein
MILKNWGNQFSSAATVRREIYIFFFFLIAFIFFACNNDWIYDESTSYNGVLNNTVWELLTYSKFKLANSHIINSLYFSLLQHGHFIDVIYYRILGLVGFLLFFTANSRILKLLKINNFYIIFLTIAPYFLFFTYGRGYGLAIGCFAMSLFYLLKYSKDQQVKYEYLIVFFGILSSLSIFSFLYGFLSILIVFGIFKIKHLKSIHTFLLAFFVLVLLFYIAKVGKIVNENDPAIIGTNNFNLFKYGTVSSIFSDFSYRNYLVDLFFNDAKILRIITYFKLLITLCVLIPMFYVRKVNFKKIDPTHIKTILVLLIFLPFLFMAAANIFAHALYPLTRAVFYLHYLILLFILVSTLTYSKKVIFYIPVIIIFFTSLVYSINAYCDLSRPTIKHALIATKNYPLYVLFTNDKSVRLIDSLYGLNKKNIKEGRSIQNIIPLVQNDTSKIRYIICWPEYRDSCLVYFKNTRVYKYRDQYSLIEIRR